MVRAILRGVAKVLRFLTRKIQNPDNRLVGDASTLARARQISQCRIHAKLKKFANTKRDRMAINAIRRRHRAVTQSAGAVQENGGMEYLPLFRHPGPPQLLQSHPIFD